MQKVRFAKTYARVNEERIESCAGIFGNGFASRQSVGVRFAFHKIFKGVFFLKRAFLFTLFFGSEVGDKALILDENRLFVQIFRLFVGGDDNHVLDLRIVRRHHVFDGVAVSRIDGFFCVGGDCRKHDCVVCKTYGFELFNPNLVAYGLDGNRQIVLYVIPKFF